MFSLSLFHVSLSPSRLSLPRLFISTFFFLFLFLDSSSPSLLFCVQFWVLTNWELFNFSYYSNWTRPRSFTETNPPHRYILRQSLQFQALQLSFTLLAIPINFLAHFLSRSDRKPIDTFTSFYKSHGLTAQRWSYDSLKNFRQISPVV